jgi:hypothetical protein
MPTILSRLRGLVAPSTPDQPLRLADSSGGGGGGGTRGSLWYEGSGAPGSITGVLANDLYLDTATSNVWQYTTSWANVGNIKGAPGTSLELTDGTTDVTGVSKITVAGAVVGGTSAAATLTISGGGGGGGSSNSNMTPDTHPATPTGVGLGPNDEFETGTAIDTAGTRYSGANAWIPFNITTDSTTVNAGSLTFLPALTGSLSLSGFVQPVPAGSWTYTAKISTYLANGSSLLGLVLATSAGATGNLYSFNLNQVLVEVQSFSNATSFVGTLNGYNNATTNVGTPGPGPTTYPIYMRISFDGTNLVFSYSLTGISFVPVVTVAASAFLGTPGLIGFAGSLRAAGASNQGTVISDWFRRTA